MTKLGYSSNGQRLETLAAVSWEANGPPLTLNDGYDVWTFFPLAYVMVLSIDQDDAEAWINIYPDGP